MTADPSRLTNVSCRLQLTPMSLSIIKTDRVQLESLVRSDGQICRGIESTTDQDHRFSIRQIHACSSCTKRSLVPEGITAIRYGGDKRESPVFGFSTREIGSHPIFITSAPCGKRRVVSKFSIRPRKSSRFPVRSQIKQIAKISVEPAGGWLRCRTGFFGILPIHLA